MEDQEQWRDASGRDHKMSKVLACITAFDELSRGLPRLGVFFCYRLSLSIKCADDPAQGRDDERE